MKKGPFGYYFEWENTKVAAEEKNEKQGKKKNGAEKPKRRSIPKYIAEPTELTIGEALRLDSLPVVLGKHPKTRRNIELTLGRFGPYLKSADKTYKLEKDASFLKMTLADAVDIINRAEAE